MDNMKVIIISVFSVILLVVAIIATSYAAFTANLTGTKDNVINTGTVSLKCNETSFNIKNATPMTDSRGIASNDNVASCELVSTMDGEMKVGYDLALTEVDELSPTDGLGINNVKIDVYKSVDDGETIYLAGTTATRGVLINTLQNEKGKYDKSIQNYNVDSATIKGNHKVNYYIKAWVTSDNAGLVTTKTEKNVCSDTKYTNETDCKNAGEVWGTKTTSSKQGGTFSFKLKIGATQVLE